MNFLRFRDRPRASSRFISEPNGSRLPQFRVYLPPDTLPPGARNRNPPHRPPWLQEILRLALHDHLHPNSHPLHVLPAHYPQWAMACVTTRGLLCPHRYRCLAPRAGGFSVRTFFTAICLVQKDWETCPQPRAFATIQTSRSHHQQRSLHLTKSADSAFCVAC